MVFSMMLMNTSDSEDALGEYFNISLLNVMLAYAFIMLKKLYQVWIFNFTEYLFRFYGEQFFSFNLSYD